MALTESELYQDWRENRLKDYLNDVSGDLLRKQQAEFLKGNSWTFDEGQHNSSQLHAFEQLAPLSRFTLAAKSISTPEQPIQKGVSKMLSKIGFLGLGHKKEEPTPSLSKDPAAEPTQTKMKK